MKKSKILVPALGILVLSTAAAVSGTVAWFAASRTAIVGVANNTIINPEGQLNCELAAGNITKVSDDKTTVSILDNHKLRDASVDFTEATPGTTGTAPTVYRAHVNENGVVQSFEEVAYYSAYNETDHVYYCATFSMTFTLDGNSTSLYDIFFDSESSSYTIDDDTVEGADPAIHNSYRLGMYTADTRLLWAPNSSGTALAYTNGTAADDLGEYTKVAKLKVDETTYASSALAQASPNYLGQIAGSESGLTGKTSLVVGCVIWFEGNDPECLASNLAAGVMSTATASIHFNAVEDVLFDAD